MKQQLSKAVTIFSLLMMVACFLLMGKVIFVFDFGFIKTCLYIVSLGFCASTFALIFDETSKK